MDIALPELKESVEAVEVNAVLVKAGDVVAKGQPLLEVQADKAALEVPSPTAGRVTAVRVKTGDQVKVGQVFCAIEPAEATSRTEMPTRKEPAKKPPLESPVQTPAGGVAGAEALRSPGSLAGASQSLSPGHPSPTGKVDGEVVAAGPATRRLGRELGIDLRQVAGSGRGGRVTEEDVRAYVKQLASTTTSRVGAATPALPSFEEFGTIERQPLSKVRQLTARHMSRAWSLIPHVTHHDEADISELEAFRKSRDSKGPKLTVTAFALKACAIALKEFPTVNASLDVANNQLVLKRYYHIGVAVDTERGLVVPVIRDVDRKSIAELAVELTETSEKARRGDVDMRGGTFTISNLGGIGGTGFTPIVNWPEVAILGISRGRLTPAFRDGQVVSRLMLPLSLSYDHRVIDGATAARFTRFIAETLENPWMMALNG